MNPRNVMAGEQNNPLDFADDKIREIEKKIQEKNKNLGSQKQEEIFARINGTPPPPQTSNPTENKYPEEATLAQTGEASPIKNLRTFQGDVADAIKRQNASVLTIALAEKKKKEGTQAETKINQSIAPVVKPTTKTTPKNPELRKNILMGILSVALILLGVGSVFGFYTLQKQEAAPTERSPQDSIFGWSKKETIAINNLKPEDIIEAIYKKRQIEGVGNGEIVFLELIQTPNSNQISPQDFFTLLKSKAPASLLRALGNQLMFGFFNIEGNNQPFLVIRLESFERTFDGMLSWEKTIFDDIGGLFTRNILPVKESLPGESGTSTRIISIGTPSNDGFLDEAIRNKDARILKNTQGETILLYSFLDRETLLITSDEEVLQELVNKLVAQKLIR